MELSSDDIDAFFAMSGDISISVDMENEKLTASSTDSSQNSVECSFSLNEYDKNLVSAGGWLAYAENNY